MSDDMRLPEGMTCGDCAAWVRCKTLICTVEPTNTRCDWNPSRFRSMGRNEATSGPGPRGRTGRIPKDRKDDFALQRLRIAQIVKVMPVVGTLLDAWDGLPNDLKSDPGMEGFSKIMAQIDSAMEGDDDGR